MGGGGEEWLVGKINGSRGKNEEKGGGGNTTQERRNPPKISLVLGAKWCFLREGGGGGII